VAAYHVAQFARIRAIINRTSASTKHPHEVVGPNGQEFAVTDEPFATWTDGPGEDPADDLTEPADPGYQDSCPRGDAPEVDPLILPFRGTVRAA